MQVAAIVTARFTSKGYSTRTIPQVTAYTVDGAIDTDADPWSVDIGDGGNDFTGIFQRDSEIRVTLKGGPTGSVQLQTGFVDTASLSEDGIISLSGRDFSSVATDSHILPYEWKNFRPHVEVAKQANMLGIPRVLLDRVNSFPKFYTDASETYWEMWYRAYRQRKRWLWTEPDGTMIAAQLAYATNPRYFIGTPPKGTGNPKAWLGVEEPVLRKDNQRRIHTQWVYGVKNKKWFRGVSKDVGLSAWRKKPVKIMASTAARNQSEATREALDELFDSKVGALEITLTVMHPGYIIRKNSIAMLNVPQRGISGLWYIVGVRLLGGPDGYMQELRLREKGFALSSRIPLDPVIADTGTGPTTANVVPALGVTWGKFFVNAAKEHKPTGIPLDVFTATLIAIAHHETGGRFENVRSTLTEYGRRPQVGRAWEPYYAQPNLDSSGAPGAPGAGNLATRQRQWREDFANQRDNPLVQAEIAVGPMQLLSRGYKDKADEYGGKKGEYDGGRWMPEHNIRAGAWALVDKLNAFRLPHTTEGLFEAVYKYGDGTRAYQATIRKLVEEEYLPTVSEGFEIARAADKAADKPATQVNRDDLVTIPERLWGGAAPGHVCGGYTKGPIRLHPSYATEAIRIADRFQMSIISGWRSEGYNKCVGGADASQHLCGAAADFSNSNGPTVQMARLARWAEARRKQGYYHMVIYGPEKIGPAESWDGHMDHVHISFSTCSAVVRDS